jgi:hypothetical protein
LLDNQIIDTGISAVCLIIKGLVNQGQLGFPKTWGDLAELQEWTKNREKEALVEKDPHRKGNSSHTVMVKVHLHRWVKVHLHLRSETGYDCV